MASDNERIASLSDERWTKKAAKWNPGLSIKYQTQTSGKTKKWENEINEFFKPDETERTNTWIKVAKNRERWKAMGSEYAKTAAAISVDAVVRRENPPQDPIRPARYLNGVKLDDDEVDNIIQLLMLPERRPLSTTGARELRDLQHWKSRVFEGAAVVDLASERLMSSDH